MNINGTNSDYINVLCGEFGKDLFRVNRIHTLYKQCNVSTLLKHILFADDTNLFYSGKHIKEVSSVVSIELGKLCKCFQVSNLSRQTDRHTLSDSIDVMMVCIAKKTSTLLTK